MWQILGIKSAPLGDLWKGFLKLGISGTSLEEKCIPPEVSLVIFCYPRCIFLWSTYIKLRKWWTWGYKNTFWGGSTKIPPKFRIKINCSELPPPNSYLKKCYLNPINRLLFCFLFEIPPNLPLLLKIMCLRVKILSNPCLENWLYPCITKHYPLHFEK